MLVRLLIVCVVGLTVAKLIPLPTVMGQTVTLATQATSVVTPTATPDRFTYRPLVNSSAAELAEYARRLTLSHCCVRVVSGTPVEVLLARPVLATELAPLALPDVRNFDNEPPLVLAIVRGSFTWMGGGPSRSEEILHYAGFVIDTTTGSPIVRMGSPDGGAFRYALNDPSLPVSTEVIPATPQPRIAGGFEWFTLNLATPGPPLTYAPTSGPVAATPTPRFTFTAIPLASGTVSPVSSVTPSPATTPTPPAVLPPKESPADDQSGP
jgi:hypothetical protein